MNNSNNQRNSSIGKWMDKENGVLCLPLHTHTHTEEYYLAVRQKEICQSHL